MAKNDRFGTRYMALGIIFLATACGEDAPRIAEAEARDSIETATEMPKDGPQPFLKATYSTFLGGRQWERAQGVFVDDKGFIYLGGHTYSKDFQTTAGAYDRTKSGRPDGAKQTDQSDGFIVKLSPDGRRVIWSTFLGGSRRDQVYTVRTDSQGNVYAIGSTGSPDFPTTEGAYDRTFNSRTQVNGLSHAFITKFGPNGNLVFSTFIGGASDNVKATVNPRAAIHIDETNDLIYFAGETTVKDFPTTPGAFQTAFGGGHQDAFVGALTIDGSALKYATYIGGRGYDTAYTEIEQHPDGSLYIAGATTSPDFPVTPGAYQTTLASGRINQHWETDGDAFVARITPQLDRLIFATYIGGKAADHVSHNQGLTIDSKGRPVFVGMTQSPDFPTTDGAFDRTHNGRLDGFAGILSADGSRLEASTFFGGAAMDTTAGAFVDGDDRVYFTGETESDDIPTTPGALQSRFGNWNSGVAALDAYLAVLSPDLKSLVYATYMGGSGTAGPLGERGRGIWIGRDNSIHVVGTTDSDDFPIIGPAIQTRYGGVQDAFLMRFDRP